MAKTFHSCICLTCGVRNDHSHPDGFCQNGHDNWLEYRDLKQRNATFKLACHLTGFTEEELIKLFKTPAVKFIPIRRSINDEVDDIINGGQPFDWDTVEANDWEFDRRMFRVDGDAICPMCKRLVKEHPIENRFSSSVYVHRMCYGQWAKT